MADPVLTDQINDLEKQKFERDDDGNTRVRVSATSQFSGLSGQGKCTEQDIDDQDWYPAPATPLAGRNSIIIQNQSDNGATMLWNYDNTAPADEGFRILDGGSKSLACKDNVVVYLRMRPGLTGTFLADEVK